MLAAPPASAPRIEQPAALVREMRARKMERVRPLLRDDMQVLTREDGVVDSLTPELREQFGVIDTENVSSLPYDQMIHDFIAPHADGLVLDCGAGLRPVYHENVVNYEIVAYSSTDVIGVAEKLPFKDSSFDAVISMAVLEHVKYPFVAAAEITRVLKPGGKLMACVPFLQPLHGYPHHYFNMTHTGLATLFEDGIAVDRQDVSLGTSPIFTLTWFLSSWASGLKSSTRKDFLDMRVRDLVKPPEQLVLHPFCLELTPEKNLELASATFLYGTKTG